MAGSTKKTVGKKVAKKAVLYLAGNAVLCCAAFIAIPKVAPYITGVIYDLIYRHDDYQKSETDVTTEVEKEQSKFINEEK